MPVCFDTALLLKLYTPEPDSPAVVALDASLTEPIFITTFHLTGFANALLCKQGRGLASDADVVRVLAKAPNWEHVFRRTLRLSAEHAAQTLCRTLDAIHVALALELGGLPSRPPTRARLRSQPQRA